MTRSRKPSPVDKTPAKCGIVEGEVTADLEPIPGRLIVGHGVGDTGGVLSGCVILSVRHVNKDGLTEQELELHLTHSEALHLARQLTAAGKLQDLD